MRGAELSVTLDGQLWNVHVSCPPCCPPRPSIRGGFPGGGTPQLRPAWDMWLNPPFPFACGDPCPVTWGLSQVLGLFPPESLRVPLEARDRRWELQGGLKRTPHRFPGWASAGSRKSPELWRPQEPEGPQTPRGPGCVISRTWPCRDTGPRSRHSHAAPSSQEDTVARLWGAGSSRPQRDVGLTA